MNKIKFKFSKLISVLFLMFTLPIAIVAGSTFLHDDIKTNNVVTTSNTNNAPFTTLNSIITNDNHDHGGTNAQGWIELTTQSSTLTIDNDANYFLSGATTASISITNGANVSLCLNGQILTALTGTRAINLIYSSFTLYDCKDGATSQTIIVDSEEYEYDSGVITGGNETSGAGVFLSYSSFTMKGGAIAGNTGTSGAGVFLGYSSSFIMEEGTISNNTSASYCGGVYVNYSSFTMKGGEIKNNSSSSPMGNEVYLQNSTFTMEGGEITNNDVNAFGYGGISIRSDSSSNSSFTMKGGYLDCTIYRSNTTDTIRLNGGYFSDRAINRVHDEYLYDENQNMYIILKITETYDPDNYKEGFPYGIYPLFTTSISDAISVNCYERNDYADKITSSINNQLTENYRIISTETTYQYREYGSSDEYTTSSSLPNDYGNWEVILIYYYSDKTDFTVYYATHTFNVTILANHNLTYSSNLGDGEHTYYCTYNDCDYSIDHTSTLISSDPDGHYYVCDSECGFITSTEAHSFDGWIDTTDEGSDKERTCNVCGYIEYLVYSSDCDDCDTGSVTTLLISLGIILLIILIVIIVISIITIRKAIRDSNRDNEKRIEKKNKEANKE